MLFAADGEWPPTTLETLIVKATPPSAGLGWGVGKVCVAWEVTIGFTLCSATVLGGDH